MPDDFYTLTRAGMLIFHFLTVHVYTRVRKHLSHLSDLAFPAEQMIH